MHQDAVFVERFDRHLLRNQFNLVGAERMLQIPLAFQGFDQYVVIHVKTGLAQTLRALSLMSCDLAVSFLCVLADARAGLLMVFSVA